MPLSTTPWLSATARNAGLVFLVVLAASLFGILTRPVGFLAAVWPANAILLAVMVRNPHWSTVAGWSSAFLGYMAADLLTGGEVLVTFWLTSANMSGAFVGYLLFMRVEEEHRRLARPLSILCMASICAIVAAVAGVVGGGAAQVLFGKDIVTGFAFWFTTELVNSIIVLPIILTAPAGLLTGAVIRRHLTGADWRPLAALALSVFGGAIIGGPGAFAYAFPALLWCALSYSLFGTALIIFLFSGVQLVLTASGVLPPAIAGDDMLVTISLRLAIALTALGPLAVASINTTRNQLLERLQYLADHDPLTGVLSRGAFICHGQRLVDEMNERNAPVSVVMIDLDHFKSVNDRYGHAAGDRVLIEAARAISANLRKGDIFGRLGGEEFALVYAPTTGDRVRNMAERLRKAVKDCAIVTSAGDTIRITASMGISKPAKSGSASLDTLLAQADNALYDAKHEGRDRVTMARARSHKARSAA